MGNIAKQVFENELTDKGLADLKAKYPSDLVADMKDDAEFKKARKTRTERNKLTEAITRRRIDITTEIKTTGDALISDVDGIYSVIVEPFEAEEKRRKAAAAEKAKKLEDLLKSQREEIAGFRNFVTDCQTGTTEEISSAIDAITNIDCQIFHKDIIHDAITTKEDVLQQLAVLLTNRAAFDASEKIRLELESTAAIESRITKLKMMPIESMGKSSDAIRHRIEKLDSFEIDASEFGDRYEEAVTARDQVIQQLSGLLEQTIIVENAKQNGTIATEAPAAESKPTGPGNRDINDFYRPDEVQGTDKEQDDQIGTITIKLPGSKRSAVISALMDKFSVEVISDRSIIVH